MLSLAAPSAAQTPPPQTVGRAPPAAAQAEPAKGPEEITVYARTQEKTKDRIFLAGDVEIRYKDLRLFADRVEIDPKTKDAWPRGTSRSSSPTSR